MSATVCGQSFVVAAIRDGTPMKKRLCDIGVTTGATLTHLFDSPMGDPAAYLVRDTVVALRRADAREIEVYPL